jgi:hypothetical protein
MLRCKRCNQTVAIGFCLCVVGEMVSQDPRPFINPDLHTHNEPKAPPPAAEIAVRAISTAVATGTQRGVGNSSSVTLISRGTDRTI